MVTRPDDLYAFIILPRRWVVARGDITPWPTAMAVRAAGLPKITSVVSRSSSPAARLAL